MSVVSCAHYLIIKTAIFTLADKSLMFPQDVAKRSLTKMSLSGGSCQNVQLGNTAMKKHAQGTKTLSGNSACVWVVGL